MSMAPISAMALYEIQSLLEEKKMDLIQQNIATRISLFGPLNASALLDVKHCFDLFLAHCGF